MTTSQEPSPEFAAPLSADELALLNSSAAELRDLARRLRAGDVSIDEAQYAYRRLEIAYLLIPLIRRQP